MDWNYEGCKSGDAADGTPCVLGPGPKVWLGASVTRTIDNISNPNYYVEIQEPPDLINIVCNCYWKVGFVGYYSLEFDRDCPQPQGSGWFQIDWKADPCEGPCEGWTIASSHYHTIDSVEWLNPETGQYETAGFSGSEINRDVLPYS